MKPTLAATFNRKSQQYPCVCSPKIDGVRCILYNGVKSRTLEDIPNDYIRKQLTPYINEGFDGELSVAGCDFYDTSSAVMSKAGEPNFTFNVFDSFKRASCDLIYRHHLINRAVLRINQTIVKIVPQVIIHSEDQLLHYHAQNVRDGYEGTIIRALDAPYKYGRSTEKDGVLLRLVDLKRDEGVLLELVEGQHNTNIATKDKRGYNKRSNTKGAKIPNGQACAAWILWQGKRVKVGMGKGINKKAKMDMWNNRVELKGKLVTFQYKRVTPNGTLREGKMLGFRSELDV